MMTATTAWAADITQNTAVVINSSNKSTYHNKSITGTVPSSSYAGQHGNFISQGAIVVDGIELNLTIDGFTADYSAFNSSATTLPPSAQAITVSLQEAEHSPVRLSASSKALYRQTAISASAMHTSQAITWATLTHSSAKPT